MCKFFKVFSKQNTKKTTDFVCLSSFLLRTPAGARTLDTLIKSQVLYQLSYGCIFMIANGCISELRMQRYDVFF